MNSEAFPLGFYSYLFVWAENFVSYITNRYLWPEVANFFIIEIQRKQTDYRCSDSHYFETDMIPRQKLYQNILY